MKTSASSLFIPGRGHSLLRLVAPLVGLLLVLSAAIDVRSVAAEEVVDLPPLMVEESAAPLRWRYAKLPGAEFLSVCSDGVTKEFLRQFHVQTELLKWILPAHFQAESSVDDKYILFNENVGRAKSQEVVETMIRNDAIRSVGPTGERFKAIDDDRSARVRFLPNLRLSDIDTTLVFVIIRESAPDSARFTFSPERIAHLLEQRVPALPGWFGAGVVALYQHASPQDDRIHFRPAKWEPAEQLAQLQKSAETPRTLLPMEELFSGRPGRLQASRAEFDALWRVQCGLFLRWIVVDEQGRRREALWKFIQRLETEPLSEALFVEHFGVGYADMRDLLSDYLNAAVNQMSVLRGPKLPKVPDIQLRAATPAEVARLRGDWERVQISFVRKTFAAAVPKYVEQAQRTLRRAYDAGERDPELLAVLGLLACDINQRSEALPFLEAAAKAQVKRPRVYYELAYSRHLAAISAHPNGLLTPEHVAEITAPLRITFALRPHLAATYTLIADAWYRTQVGPPDAEMELLNRGYELFPLVPALVLRIADLNTRRGYVQLAERQLNSLLPYTQDPKLREIIEMSLRQMPDVLRRQSRAGEHPSKP